MPSSKAFPLSLASLRTLSCLSCIPNINTVLETTREIITLPAYMMSEVQVQAQTFNYLFLYHNY